MLPSNEENILPENVFEVSFQISGSDTPKTWSTKSYIQLNPQSLIYRPHLRQQKSVMKQLEQKRMPVAFFSGRTIVRSMKKKTKRKFNPPFLAANLLKNKNQGIMKASEATKLKTNATQCQTGKCAKLSKVDNVELKTMKIKSTKIKTTIKEKGTKYKIFQRSLITLCYKALRK